MQLLSSFYYLLALEWNHKLNTHTLHGLWPQWSPGEWPEYCTREKFNLTQIEDLLPKMKKYWPSIYPGTNIAFWTHEWTRHGTCDFNKLSQHDYFEKTLDLYNQYSDQCYEKIDCQISLDLNFQLFTPI